MRRGRTLRGLCAVLLCGVLAAALAPASGLAQAPIRVVVDGSAVRLDQPPVLIRGRVLVPLRGVFEKMGALVQWKGATRTVLVVRPGIYVEARVGSTTASVSGATVPLDVPARIVGRRILVPLRFISEALGVSVVWRAADRTVVISTQTAGPVQGQVAVTTASGYGVGQPVAVTIANGTAASIYTEDSKTDCSIVTLERRAGSGWEPIRGCRFGRPPLLIEIKSGERRTATIDPKSTHLAFGAAQVGFGAGTYRVRFSYSVSRMLAGAEPEAAYSSEFAIR